MKSPESKDTKYEFNSFEKFLCHLIFTLCGILIGYMVSLPIGVVLVMSGFDLSKPASFFVFCSFVGALVFYLYTDKILYTQKDKK